MESPLTWRWRVLAAAAGPVLEVSGAAGEGVNAALRALVAVIDAAREPAPRAEYAP